jgi:DNA-binding beta-propeller fold protein YncE
MALRRLAVAAAIIGLAGIAAPAAAAPPTNGVRELITDLSSPKGVAVLPNGDPVVAQGAFGPPGPVLVLPLTGPGRGVPVEVTEPFGLVDVAISPLDGLGWGLGSDQVLYHELADGTIEAVLDVAAYQATDPDPVDQEGIPTESNPYGLTVLPNGDALVADAAANDIVRVTPAGVATTLARFDVQTIATDHLPFPFPFPTLDAEAVPTTVTVGPDGAVYVGELKGFPFRPGTSNIWRIDPDAEGAWCSTAGSSGGCALHDDGYTAVQDIAFNPNNGRLYVLELAADGVLAFEAGFETGQFPPGVLLEVSRNHVRELAAGQLSQPGGIAIARNNKIYVTDGVFTSGRLLQVQR